ncbi:zinc finger, CCHC-type, retrotransposon gag domain protein [Tanacetum coccineum]|uniref:Zinc finger, CCHC-type, retrotransposon gag domain protein n=1 Tax=Tanacetum coccineum TaxID=301880 RepID=A0ABQ4ZHR8_9ASTR
MSPGTKLGDHIDEFNKFILDLANIDIEIEDEDRALMLLTSLPLSYEKFVETLLFRIGKNYLTMEFSSGDSKFKGFKSRGGTGKLSASYVIQRVSSEREIVQEREALAVVRNDETTELVMDSGGPYHMTHMREFLYDFKVFDCGSVRFGDNRTCTIKGTGKVKIQLHDGSSFILEDVRMTGGLKQVGLKQLGSKQVGFKQLGHKQVGFKQLGPGVETGVHRVQVEKCVWFEVELQGAQGDREAEVFQVSNDDTAVAQRQLEDKQLEENTNTDSKLVKGARKRLTLVERCGQTFLTVTGVTGNLREEGIVAEKKKVEDSKKANTRDNTEVHLSGHRRKLNLICNAVADKVQVVWRKNLTDSAGVLYQGTNTAYPTNVYGVLGNTTTDTAYYKSKCNTTYSINEYGVFILWSIQCARIYEYRVSIFLNTEYSLLNLNLIASQKEKMVAEIIRRESRKLLTSMGSSVLIDDAIRDESENESSSDSEGLNHGGFTEEETKALRSMINKQVGKAIKNVMPFYISQTTDNLKECLKLNGTLDRLLVTNGSQPGEGAFCTSCCKEKNKVNFASNFLRDSAKMWWEGKIYEKEEWIGTCTWKKFKEMFTTEYTPVEEVDKIQEEFLTITQTNETVNEMWKKFNHLIRYCIEYHGNEKLKVEKFQRMLRNDIREVISPFKCTTLEDLLSRARLREADLLRKKNKDTKRKLDFVDRDAKKPKL